MILCDGVEVGSRVAGTWPGQLAEDAPGPPSIEASRTPAEIDTMPSSASSHSKRLTRAVENLIHCPACSLWRLRPPKSRRASPLSKKRWASNLVSSTAVNAVKSIPPRNRNLHQALIDLGRKAPGQVSLSRLQLAIRGLESEHPTTRIALLGINVPATARRLSRLLLADSSKLQQDWEGRVLLEGTEGSQSLVIRFGNPRNEALQSPRNALPVLLTPAPVLRNHCIEILISSVSGENPRGTSNQYTPSDVWLSPTIGTPASADGRQSLISQPVHRTMVVADGVDELLTVAELLARTKFESKTERRLIDVVVNLDGEVGSTTSNSIRVDIAKADEGLKVVREDLTKAPHYEKAWTESGMPALSKWLASSSAKSRVGLSPLLKDLIASVVESTAAKIASEAEEAKRTARSKAMTNEARVSLETAINAFSQQGHAELQSGLAAAWSSRNWRKLAFWKLFWRVDDVPLIVTDLVTTAWLPRTERAVYELTGRMKQAGISMPSYPIPNVFSEPQTSSIPIQADVREAAPNVFNQPLILASTASAEAVSTPLLPPARYVTQKGPIAYLTPSLASNISISRQNFILTAITTLTSSAQQIVLKSLTIAGASAALSAISFLSITSGSFYESATIVALGTAYALRRMQREWEAQCKDLEHMLMEEGRSVLKQTEEYMRRLVKDASKVVEDAVEERARNEALEAVDKAKLALSELK
jgi:hypothetical protein